jgi:hypothetical protein
MEDMQEENAQIAEDIPKLEAKIKDLHEQLKEAARRTRVIEIHRSADGANVGMKAMVVKLSGDAKAKFEVDHKMSSDQFTRLVFKLSQNESGETDLDLFEKYCTAFNRALNEGADPFKGDLENETYKNILAAFRAFDPNATE